MKLECSCGFGSRFGCAVWLILVFSIGQTPLGAEADETWLFAVQLAAAIQTNPPQITLSWPQDPYGANSYTVYRKSRDDQDWGIGIALSGSQTNFTDTNVSVGTTYEYQVEKQTVVGYAGYGYIYCGIEAPAIEDRGKLLLMVADNMAAPLSNELARLESDLTGDGWQVIRHNVSTNDSPDHVRSLIVDDYFREANVQAVFLFGHIPILHSGNVNYDGHEDRPMPADAFYGDVDGDWSSSPDFIPSDIELMVGRVDLFDMPGNGSARPWPNETELLRNYLNKDHAWRFGKTEVLQRALMCDRRGVDSGWAPAASGYRNFDPLLGHDSVDFSNWADHAPPSQRWASILEDQSYVWGCACGAGSPTGVSFAGNSGDYSEAWSTDIVDGDAKVVFVMLFGSWFGNWDGTDNFMRSFLATPTLGLTACLSGEPHWNFHHMAMGETIGFSTRVTMNNSTTYRSETNDFTRGNFIALMGDPTLRMYPVVPPSNLEAMATTQDGVLLSWQASPDDVIGYYVYRATSINGPFTRLDNLPITTTQYLDSQFRSGHNLYMVRAVKLQQTASGTFFNPSQGIFVQIDLPKTPIYLSANLSETGITLSWNSQPGEVYRIQATDSLSDQNWIDVSGPLTATSETSAWTDSNALHAQHFYRIAVP